MRHSVFGRKLSRTKNERRRLFAGLIRDLLIVGAITTTLAKAKAVAPIVEKLITKAKEGGDASRRRVLSVLPDKNLVGKLFDEAKSRFASRTSGWTRVVKIGSRKGDASQMAILSFVDQPMAIEVMKPKTDKKGSEKPAKEKKTPVKKATVSKKPKNSKKHT